MQYCINLGRRTATWRRSEEVSVQGCSGFVCCGPGAVLHRQQRMHLRGYSALEDARASGRRKRVVSSAVAASICLRQKSRYQGFARQ